MGIWETIKLMLTAGKQLPSIDSDAPQWAKLYQASRTIKEPTYLCHAPFNNMYFNSLGEVANCWLTFEDPEHYDGTRSIMDIWMGEKFTKLREAIKTYNLDYKCQTCKHYLQLGNHVNVLANAYDNNTPLIDYPTMLEFELSNTCNLECTMCTGLLSSAIRKNRDKLPALKSPYGERFVEELREFIPYLNEARFNGGEPFLINIYWKIWDAIIELNPSLMITVATNGTVLTQRVKEYLARGNFHINLSIDSLNPGVYESIRINAKLDAVLRNFEYFKDYCKIHNRKMCIMINPMRQNWEEMMDFVDFCNLHDVSLWFNTVVHPNDQAMWNLPYSQLQHIYNTLSEKRANKAFKQMPKNYRYNIDTYHNLVEVQIKKWMEEAMERERKLANLETSAEMANWKQEDIFKHQMQIVVAKHYKVYGIPSNEIMESIRIKLDQIEAYIDGKVDKEVFYNLANQTGASSVVGFLFENDIEAIKEQIEQQLVAKK